MRCDRLKCLDSLGEPQGSPFFWDVARDRDSNVRD